MQRDRKKKTSHGSVEARRRSVDPQRAPLHRSSASRYLYDRVRHQDFVKKKKKSECFSGWWTAAFRFDIFNEIYVHIYILFENAISDLWSTRIRTTYVRVWLCHDATDDEPNTRGRLGRKHRNVRNSQPLRYRIPRTFGEKWRERKARHFSRASGRFFPFLFHSQRRHFKCSSF